MILFLKNKFSFFIYIENIIILSLLPNSFSYSKIDINYLCSQPTYDNISITQECISGPPKTTRILQYETFDDYIAKHNYKHNGLPFYASLLVDTNYHNFWDFMDGGMVIILLLSISIILFIAWIPMIFCWKYECCIFDECCTDNKCCKIFLNILIYFLIIALLSFIIVCIIFSE